MCFEKFGTWAFKQAMGVTIVRLAATWKNFGADMKNCKNGFFAKFPSPRHFCKGNFSRIEPCESWSPEDSENVVFFGIFFRGVIAVQSLNMGPKVKASPKLEGVQKKTWPQFLDFRVAIESALSSCPILLVPFDLQEHKIQNMLCLLWIILVCQIKGISTIFNKGKAALYRKSTFFE